MSAAPGRPKQARTAARQSEGTLMSRRAVPKAISAVRSMKVA